MKQAVQKIILAKQKILNPVQKILMTSLKNILTSLKNLKRILTGEEKILIPSFKILMVSFGILVSSFLIINNTYADESSNLNYSVTVEPALNITTSSNKVSLDLNPLNHDFDSQDLTVSVSTNNETGYKLYVNTENKTTQLIEKDDSNLYIETLDKEATSDTDFTLNRWGYKLNSSATNFSPFNPGALVLSSKTNADGKNTDDIATMVFAAKVGYETKAGTYALALNFQATANPHVKTIADAEYMQEVDSLAVGGCPADLPEDTVYTLKDARDGKEYKVARLKDGNCWMVSNLNLAGGTKLYSETSNVPDGYSQDDNKPYYTLPVSSTSGFSNTSTAYVYNTGNETTNQADCTSTKPCNSYYSWLAATVGGKDANGNAVTENGKNAAFSICPKGWRLPTTGNRDNGALSYKNGDFYKLAIQYGKSADSYTEDNATAFYSQNGAGPGTIPNFLISGRYENGSFALGGDRSNYWSSSSRPSDSSAYDFYINIDTKTVNVAGWDYASKGFPIRCLLAE